DGGAEPAREQAAVGRVAREVRADHQRFRTPLGCERLAGVEEQVELAHAGAGSHGAELDETRSASGFGTRAGVTHREADQSVALSNEDGVAEAVGCDGENVAGHVETLI